jgi:LuxR family transcriptional regulator of csgAB operon
MLVETLGQIHQCKHSFTLTASLDKIPENIRNITSNRVLFFLDCFALERSSLAALLNSAYQIAQPDNLLALFNIAENSGIEKKALDYGIQGFFHPDDSSADFCKGTRRILNGEVWLSRKIMSEVILAGIRPPSQHDIHAATGTANLSLREKEVLTHLVSGASNEAIAAELFISVHTLRTHLYHIYRKINVHNRFQAIRWAEKNL